MTVLSSACTPKCDLHPDTVAIVHITARKGQPFAGDTITLCSTCVADFQLDDPANPVPGAAWVSICHPT